MPDPTTFADWVRRRRKALDLTQAALAEQVGCAVVTLRKIEQETRRPSRELAELLAERLAIPTAQRDAFVGLGRGGYVERLPSAPDIVEPPIFLPTGNEDVRPKPFVAREQELAALPVARPHNLPLQPTPFIGREPELAALTGLLADPQCRLITLLGPGGIGKTRLALQAASNERKAFADGSAYVALASLNSAEFIVPALAAALNFTLDGHAAPKTQLLRYLRRKEVLLVLDNIEHLLTSPLPLQAGKQDNSTTELLTDILQQAPNVTLLVTSRERLQLSAETVFWLAGMDYPEAENGDRESYSALDLFAQRARQVQPGFAPDEEDRQAIARICRLVGGMPLGIVLAAGWVAVLSPRRIATELEQNLELLETDLRDVPARQRSMQAVFEQTWERLSLTEQTTYMALSVFGQGFTYPAARTVAEASPTILAGLANKGLLARSPDGRYHLHELLRQYAAQKLERQSGEREKIQERHAAYYAAFLHKREEALTGARQTETLSEIRQEMDNVRRAWRWAVAKRRFAAIEQAVNGLGYFYMTQGWLREGAEAFSKAMSMVEATRSAESTDIPQGTDATRVRIRIRLLERLGWMKRGLGEHSAAYQDLEAGLALTRETGDRAYEAKFSRALGVLAWDEEKPDKANQLLQNALEIQQEIGDRKGLVGSLQNLGLVAEQQEKYPQAMHYYGDSLKLSREVGDRYHEGYALNNLAFLHGIEGNYAEAERYCRNALAIANELDNQRMQAIFLCNLGFILFHQGQYARAKHCFDQSLQSILERGIAGSLEALVGIAYLETQAGKTARALQLLGLVVNHPTEGHDLKIRATPLLAQLKDRLSADFVAANLEAGRWLDIDVVAREILEGK